MSRVVTIKLDDELLEAVTTIANKYCISRSAVIKAAIREFVKKHGYVRDDIITVRVVRAW